MSSSSEWLRIQLSFRIMGGNLDPDAVSAALHLAPTECHRRGDPHLGKGGRRYGTFREGLWVLRSAAAVEAPLEAHLTNVLHQLNGRASALQQLRETGLRTDVFAGVFGITDSCGISLSPEFARALGELGLTIGFDLYPAGEPETAVAANREPSGG